MARSLIDWLRRSRVPIYVLALGALFLWLRQGTSSMEGVQAPAITLPLVDSSGSVALGGGDKPLLVEVFASWCGTCRRSLPLLSEAARRHAGELDVVAVSVDNTLEEALWAKRTWPIEQRVAYDAQRAFARSYGIEVLPTFVLIDSQGQVRQVRAGAVGERQLESWLASLSQ